MSNETSPAQTMIQRLLCCVCGQSTDDSGDYVLLGISSPIGPAEQWLGAHAEHLNGVLARGFSVEVHTM
ncbi:hypothetical protein [Kitasatospora fiedleri]|uniref:hypothetical protein n=1 Tax=Kitasatospora fiedleri TaxID=2991545 RepID=UPI00249B04DD|nr:hypothetical protein [Kitasatospora fiedleri]